VKFKRLGLLIIDEEHRFGVRHKEQMKALRAEVDVLTLTATPIPRTLGMALEGLRDLSVIATAPQRRLAIKTFVRSEGSSVIREAVLRELKRGGQVYFLHNEVETIQNRAQPARRAAARGAHRGRPRPDARARAGKRDARLRRPAPQPAAVLDHHRNRHRRAQRQHHRHQPRRQVRAGPAAPAARARRPQPPPGLRLPAGARRARA
jgi:superfamily II DNA or RNA helicase